MSQGLSQDFPLLSPQDSFGSQDPPNLLTPRENSSFYNLHPIRHLSIPDVESNTPNPSQTPPRKKNRPNISFSQSSRGYMDTGRSIVITYSYIFISPDSQRTFTLPDSLSQASTISLMGSQDLRISDNTEEVEEPYFAAPDLNTEDIFGENLIPQDIEAWGALVCLQNSTIFQLRAKDKLVCGRSSKSDVW